MQYNVDDIERHIKKITSRWNELVDDPYFEIRCIKENFEPHNQKFKRSQIDDAIKFACKNNAEKYNVYITVNPISSRSNGRSATDQDIIASFFCFCDCDTVIVILFCSNFDRTNLGQDDHIPWVHLSLEKLFISDKLDEDEGLLFCEWESHKSSLSVFVYVYNLTSYVSDLSSRALISSISSYSLSISS